MPADNWNGEIAVPIVRDADYTVMWFPRTAFHGSDIIALHATRSRGWINVRVARDTTGRGPTERESCEVEVEPLHHNGDTFRRYQQIALNCRSV